jgi:hypothetical protein
MATVIPPLKPPALSDENPLQRVRFRLWQIVMTGFTLLLTAWFFTISVLAGIIAVLVAKHILVAILAVGLHLPPKRSEQPPTSEY